MGNRGRPKKYKRVSINVGRKGSKPRRIIEEIEDQAGTSVSEFVKRAIINEYDRIKGGLSKEDQRKEIISKIKRLKQEKKPIQKRIEALTEELDKLKDN